MRSPQEFIEGLRDGRRVYVLGERVEDVTTHPILQITTRHSATAFHVPTEEDRDLWVTTDRETGQEVNAYFRTLVEPDDLRRRRDLIEENTRICRSTFNIVKAVGTDALAALTVVTEGLAGAGHPEYRDRVSAYRLRCAGDDLAMAMAQTDVKGDRSLPPGRQPHADAYVHVVDRRSDGIVVRGAKAHTTAAPVVDELIVIPTRAMREDEADYAVAFAVPVDTPGLTLVCRPTGSVEQSWYDFPVSRRNIETETVTVFEDVFVPWERVFLCGEWQFAGELAVTFATYHRFTGISYKPPFCDLLVGAALLAAESNGLQKHSRTKEIVARLVQYTQLIRAASEAAAAAAVPALGGLVMPHQSYTNAGKLHFASGLHDACQLVQDLAGGLVITAPVEKDLDSEVGPLMNRYLAGAEGWSGRDRVGVFHLIRDLTASDFGGYNYVATLHGEGSPAAQLLGGLRSYDLDRSRQYALDVLSDQDIAPTSGGMQRKT